MVMLITHFFFWKCPWPHLFLFPWFFVCLFVFSSVVKSLFYNYMVSAPYTLGM